MMASEYDLDKNQLYEIFHEKGIVNLYHANTVATSLSFLSKGSLLSRKYVADNGLFQTEQYSDAKDLKFNIWDGIFLDAMDIHSEFRKRNFYGPLLFSFNLDLLKSDLINNIRITKTNPVRWTLEQTEKDWYYSDLKEFSENYKKGNKAKDVGSMLILNDIGGKLSLRPFLNKFILDNPNISVSYDSKQQYLIDVIADNLRQKITQYDFQDIPRELRHPNAIYNCACWSEYKNLDVGELTNLKKLFHPTAGK